MSKIINMKMPVALEEFWKKIKRESIPFNCLFELTYKCNLKCIHCYNTRKNKQEMGSEDIFMILRQLKKAGCLFLIFTGGEIFLRKDFFTIANYARKLDFALILFTNGTLIDKDIAKRVEKLYPVRVEVSLYGFQDTHDSITGLRGSFDKTVKAVKLLKERGITVYVKAIVMKQNVEELTDLRDYIEKDLKAVAQITESGFLISSRIDGNKKPLKCRLTDRQLEDFIKQQMAACNFPVKQGKMRTIKYDDALCDAGRAACSITPYGDVNPCVIVSFKKGNSLKDRSFEEIWTENEEIKNFRDLRIKDRKDCIECNLFSYCNVCPGMTFLEERSFTARFREACRQARIRKKIYEQYSPQENRASYTSGYPNIS